VCDSPNRYLSARIQPKIIIRWPVVPQAAEEHLEKQNNAEAEQIRIVQEKEVKEKGSCLCSVAPPEPFSLGAAHHSSLMNLL